MVQSVPPDEHVLEAEQRVVGDVEAEHLALVAEQRHLVPLVDVGHRDRDPEAAAASSSSPPNSESWPIASLRLMSTYWSTAVSWMATSARRRCFMLVEGAGLDQRLDDPLVADQRRDLVHEVVEVGEPALLARAPRRSPSTTLCADVADRGEAEADVGADRGEVATPTR